MNLAKALDVVSIPAGTFMMGSNEGQENERPVHRVRVDAFAIGKYPVTNRGYGIFVLQSGRPAPPFWSDAQFCAPEQPVVGVTWDEAAAFCAWLSERGGMPFRLPTEAEWEYAARGGVDGAHYPWGNEPPDEKHLVGCDPVTGGPAEVGVNPPNGFGLFDMSENVHEWCADYYDYNYYHYSPEKNPHGPSAGQRRVSRGGSWRHRIKFSRCAARSSLPPDFQYSDYGFRVAVTIG
ncbi:MAG TPA: formylglycine-generating enzyme family protein [Terriglobales bacterium]|jgi:formylglycine-generating enzyme required for sulfatase activity|nr:formylglycine-generating enzyme family protein [Terriglobales bacterium]